MKNNNKIITIKLYNIFDYYSFLKKEYTIEFHIDFMFQIFRKKRGGKNYEI